MKKISFSPVTRLSGLLSVDVYVEDNKVIDAKVKGEQFRGFEWMMIGKNVTDAPYFTERICGICSFAHGTVSNYLLDEIFADEVPEQGQALRNIMLGLEFLQNHIRHFYLFCLPDYVRFPESLPYQGPNPDLRFDKQTNDRLIENYLESFSLAAKAHEAQTLFGGKAPHPHGAVHGGVTVQPTADNIMHARSLVQKICGFIHDKLLPDTESLSSRYQDYFNIGVSAKRFLSFGLFKTADGWFWPEGVIDEAFSRQVQHDNIAEDVSNSWYRSPNESLDPLDLTPPDPKKEDAYTFVKSVHYNRRPFEVGPLARLQIREGYARKPSTMARIVARSVEAEKIAFLVRQWLKSLQPNATVLNRNEVPAKNSAYALTDAPRGALLHQTSLEGDTIKRYGIITPTVWNFSPRNRYGDHGPVEEALIGTELADPALPVEIGRIVRAFDPCLSCGTHVIRL